MRRRFGVQLLVAGAMVAVTMTPVSANGGFVTSEDLMLDPMGNPAMALISSGDMVGDFVFEGIPDGVGIIPGPTAGTAEVFVAHEQSLSAPFRGEADFEDSSISRLLVNTGYPSIQSGTVAVPGSDGWQRFCSAGILTPDEGFDDYWFITGEESSEVVDLRPGSPIPADPGLDGQRQAGLALVLNTKTGDYTSVPGMGRVNHENTISVPGDWPGIALVTTDDTFSRPSAQLYMYLASSDEAVWEDKGSLWAFRVNGTEDGNVRANDPFNGANDYGDIQVGDSWQGEFIRVPKKIARGNQDVLEEWSNDNNVFQFIRLEDLAYDLNDPHVLYIADTGGSGISPDPETGRLARGDQNIAPNGRVFRLEFDHKNPKKVTSLSVLADGDVTAGSPGYVDMTSPDNVGISQNSLMIQEDTFMGKIHRYDFASQTWSVVAQTLGNAESSGIVDASQWFGAGTWLLTIQNHADSDWVDMELRADGIQLKREAGQLILFTVAGS